MPTPRDLTAAACYTSRWRAGDGLRGTMKDLEGRVALVTGAGRGIGAATARALAIAGANVIVTDLTAPASLSEELAGLACKQDVTSEAEWIETIALATGRFAGLDILVNNAG